MDQEHMRIFDNLQDALKVKGDRIRQLERENVELNAKYQAIQKTLKLLRRLYTAIPIPVNPSLNFRRIQSTCWQGRIKMLW